MIRIEERVLPSTSSSSSTSTPNNNSTSDSALTNSTSTSASSSSSNQDRSYEIKTLCGHDLPIRALAIWRDWVCSGCGNAEIRLWDMSTGHCVKILKTLIGTVYSMVSWKDTLLCSAYGSSTIRIWMVETGDCVRVLAEHGGPITSLVTATISKNSKNNNNNSPSLSYKEEQLVLCSGSWDTTVRVWNVETGECLRILSGHTLWVECLVVWNGFLVSGQDESRQRQGENSARVWDLDSGQCVEVLPHSPSVLSLEVWGDLLCAVTKNKGVAMWKRNNELEGGTSEFNGHFGSSDVISISSWYHCLCTGHDKGDIKLWNRQLQLVGTLARNGFGVRSMMVYKKNTLLCADNTIVRAFEWPFPVWSPETHEKFAKEDKRRVVAVLMLCDSRWHPDSPLSWLPQEIIFYILSFAIAIEWPSPTIQQTSGKRKREEGELYFQIK